jgi:hypothetical protein
MKLIVMIIIYLVVNNAIDAVPIGIIHNASLMVMPSSNITINQPTCNECVCAMLTAGGNSSIVSFNCYIQNITSVICELFTLANYQNSTFYQMEINVSSAFYFLQLPPNIRSANGRTSFSLLLLEGSKRSDIVTY